MKKHAARGVYPALRGVMGNWVYYSTVMSAQQISDSVISSKLIREEQSLEDHLQRDLQPRVDAIRNYLLVEPSRFFNSIIVGVFDGVPQWIEFDLEKPAKAVPLSLADQATIKASVGLLRLTGDERMFAIDGQHRTEAITRAWAERTSPKKKPASYLDLADDQYSVILVAHVDDEQGKKRTRRLFSDINKRAKPVSKGDLAIIDEEDISAIVARRLYADYKPFKRLGPDPISLTPATNLDPKDTTHFTNLLTLVTVARKLKPLYKKKRGLPEFAEDNVIELRKIAETFFDFIIDASPDLAQLFARKLTLSALREKQRSLLARPLGLILLARLYTLFTKAGDQEVLADGLSKMDFALSGPVFDRLLWNRGRMETKNAALAFDLCVYLLGRMDLQDEPELLEAYRIAVKNDQAALPPKVL